MLRCFMATDTPIGDVQSQRASSLDDTMLSWCGFRSNWTDIMSFCFSAMSGSCFTKPFRFAGLDNLQENPFPQVSNPLVSFSKTGQTLSTGPDDPIGRRHPARFSAFQPRVKHRRANNALHRTRESAPSARLPDPVKASVGSGKHYLRNSSRGTRD